MEMLEDMMDKSKARKIKSANDERQKPPLVLQLFLQNSIQNDSTRPQ